MVDRRGFMQYGAGLAAALFAPRVAGARPSRRAAVAPDIVLIDRELVRGGDFAAQARARGITAFEFSSDAGGSWMRELEPRLRAGPTAIEGYTSAATLFCLELLARDYGGRIVRRRDTPHGVTWLLSSNPLRRAALAPLPARSAPHA